MNTYLSMLGLDTILEQAAQYAASQEAYNRIIAMEPSLNEAECKRRMDETTAARSVLDACGSPPLAVMKDLEETLTLCQIGAQCTPEQLNGIALFCTSCKRMRAYCARAEAQNRELSLLGQSFMPLEDVQQEIDRCVDTEKVLDEASPRLRDLRRKMDYTENKIREKLNQILQSRKQYLADGYITRRNGRYVLPVQRRYQNQFGGVVVDASASGSTLFMEPGAIGDLQAELAALTVEEDAETRRILYTLAAMVTTKENPIRRNMETMLVLDVLFARAKLSASMKARGVEISTRRDIQLIQARHPLLAPELCVPLDFAMDENISGVIITGPNTGGKTVAVKTVGLLTAMAQCGLHIPCAEGSRIAMQDAIWCDIGDSQNISQNLSTFSGHITNVIRILDGASSDSLVLLDELGSGTDPAEGMGIAIAVLEELRRRGCMYLVTTHYPQVKIYAEKTERVRSARMAFDPLTLAPQYRLEMDRSGESCALLIAARLGLAPSLIARAKQEVYGEHDDHKQPCTALPVPPSRLVRYQPPKENRNPSGKFTMGDSVQLLPGLETGIVYRPADDAGNVIVQVRDQKRAVNHTRLRLQVPASELYPPDYDFSVVFDTVANRKAAHILSKRYDDRAQRVYEANEGIIGGKE